MTQHAGAARQPTFDEEEEEPRFRHVQSLGGAQVRVETQLAGLIKGQRQTNELLMQMDAKLTTVYRIFSNESGGLDNIEEMIRRIPSAPSNVAAPAAPQESRRPLIMGPTKTFCAFSDNVNWAEEEQGDESDEEDMNFCSLPASWPASVPIRSQIEKTEEDQFAQANSAPSHHSVFIKRLVAARSSEDKLGVQASVASVMRLVHFERRRDRCSLHPHSTVRMIIDICSLFLLIYDLVGIPLVIAWDLAMAGTLKMISLCVVSWWSFEIAVNFCTGIYVDGRLVTRHTTIAHRYLKSWFALDLLVALSDWISLVLLPMVENADGQRFAGIIRTTKFVRFLRFSGVLLRAVRLSDLFARLIDRAGPGALIFGEVCKLLMSVLWVNHCITCAWFAAGRLMPTDTDLRWLETTIGDSPLKYKDASWSFQYLTAFHWSLTQMTPGSMQVFPLNSGERVINIICLVLGVIFFSSLVSTISAKMTQYMITKQGQLQEQRMLRRFLDDSGVEAAIAMEVYRAASKTAAARRPLLFGDVKLISKIPVQLQQRLMFALCSPHLLAHPLFQWWSAEDETGLAELLHANVSFAGLPVSGVLFSPGMQAHATYVVTKGSMKYTQEPKTSKSPVKRSVRVEKGTWISEAALWSEWKHVGAMDATSPCELMVLNVEGFLKDLKNNPGVQSIVAEYGRAFHLRLSTARPPSEPWPSDLPLPSCEFDKILPGLSQYARETIGAMAIQVMEEHRGWTSKITGRTLQSLYVDIQQGKCSLMISGTGEVKRVVHVAALRIERDDEQIFVQLGTVHSADGQDTEDPEKLALTPDCKLPGGRRTPGQRSLDVVTHLLGGLLAPLRAAVTVQQPPSVQVEESVSASTGIRTKYTKTLFNAKLDSTFDTAALVKVVTQLPEDDGTRTGTPSRRPSRRKSPSVSSASHAQEDATMAMLLNTDVYMLSDGGGTAALFAWLSEQEFATLRRQQSMLDRWSGTLHLRNADISEAAAKAGSLFSV